MKTPKSQAAIIKLIVKNGKDITGSPNMKREKDFIQHGSISCFVHSVSVAYLSVWLVKKLGIRADVAGLIRGALLHDYFLYDWHIPTPESRLHGFRHAGTALRNASRDFDLGWIEKDIIEKHMFPLNLSLPRCRESLIVCLADKICATWEVFSFCPFLGAIRIIERKS